MLGGFNGVYDCEGFGWDGLDWMASYIHVGLGGVMVGRFAGAMGRKREVDDCGEKTARGIRRDKV